MPWTIACQLDRSVDLIDLKRASTVMAKEVLRTGTPLSITNPSSQQDFEMRVLADYARLNEERQPILQMIRHAGDSSVAIDWELVTDYLVLFNLGDKLPELTHVYGQTH